MRTYSKEEWQHFVDNCRRHLHQMSPDNMDYDMMNQVYIKVKNQEPFHYLIKAYAETYFRELIESLKPWSPAYNPTRRSIQD